MVLNENECLNALYNANHRELHVSTVMGFYVTLKYPDVIEAHRSDYQKIILKTHLKLSSAATVEEAEAAKRYLYEREILWNLLMWGLAGKRERRTL